MQSNSSHDNHFNAEGRQWYLNNIILDIESEGELRTKIKNTDINKNHSGTSLNAHTVFSRNFFSVVNSKRVVFSPPLTNFLQYISQS